VLAVEVSSFQLHWTSTVEFLSGALLNIAPDHLDWHGSLDAYAADKALVWRSDWYALYNADDPLVAAMAQRVADRQDFSLDPTADHCFGLAGDSLVDRCIGTSPGEAAPRVGGGVELARVSDIPVPGPHNVANALAAAALARALESASGGRWVVPLRAVRDGLRAFRPDPHRIDLVASVDGVDYVDDSKATNAHAAAASLAAFRPVVWIAGGLAKGAEFGELVADAAERLRGVVLLGRDRALIADALARHAPQVPVVDVPATDTGSMDDVVRAARGLARPGDTVLLAPACASMDMFTDYGQRGDAFAAAVRRLTP
jgi:UDP-N-acetylmuramoylalanine--D-glutamate ligase